LAFNDLSDQTDLDEQEGMMHLFVPSSASGTQAGTRSLKVLSNAPSSNISLLSLLAYRVQEAKRRKGP
jgi:hypothetical protein